MVHLRVILVFWIMVLGHQVLAGADQDLQREARRQTEAIGTAGASWPTVQTAHFLIHYQPGRRPDPVACAALDSFTARVVGLFALPDSWQARLTAAPIDYYLCDDATVSRVTGYPTKGMADLAGRAIISSHFPHFHELVHLLVDQARPDPALQSLPLIQEGIACLLGGRWGRSSEVVLFTGFVHQSMSPSDWRQALTQDGFHSFPGGPDAAYPLGALVCGIVRDQAGWPGILELENRLSGSVDMVAGLTAQDFFAAAAGVMGVPPAEVESWLNGELEKGWSRHRRCGILPPSGTAGEEVLTVQADSFPCYRLSAPNPHQNAESSLFMDHFGEERLYEGQRFCLRVSPEEIAFYDYATNQLLAIWVAGFTEEFGACSTGPDRVSFTIAADFPWGDSLRQILRER